MEALAAVLDPDPAPLKALISKFSSAAAVDPKSKVATQGGSSAASVAGRGALGFAPPCASYAQLITLRAFASMHEAFTDAASHDHLKMVNASIALARKSMQSCQLQ